MSFLYQLFIEDLASIDILRSNLKATDQKMNIDHESFINSPENRIIYKVETNIPANINNIQSNSSIELVGNKITIATTLPNQQIKYLILDPDMRSTITFNIKENLIISLTNIFISSLLNTLNYEFKFYKNTEFRIQKSMWNLSLFHCNFYQYGNCNYIINSKQFPGSLYIMDPNSTTRLSSFKDFIEFQYFQLQGNVFFDFPDDSKIIISALFINSSGNTTVNLGRTPMNVEILEINVPFCEIISGPIYLNQFIVVNSTIVFDSIVGIGEKPSIAIQNDENHLIKANSILNFKTQILHKSDQYIGHEYTLFYTKEPMNLIS